MSNDDLSRVASHRKPPKKRHIVRNIILAIIIILLILAGVFAATAFHKIDDK